MASSETVRSQDRIVWVDCEMTGLDLGSDALVEVACVVTDAELRELDGGVTVVIRPPDQPFADMPDVVRQMHTASGLIEEIPNGTTVAEAERIVLDYVKSHVPESRKAPLAGSSVYVDRGFLARDMPELDAYLHYRLIDVSSVKELVRRWYPRVYFNAPAKVGNHRALADARESIAELRYYRDAVLVPQPGPGTDAARDIAARHVLAPFDDGAEAAPEA
jgi:oligoribonuclease